MDKKRPLEGKVAVVAGATRGAGRGIACMLGEAGATVYCTARSVRGRPSTPGRPETIDETAEMVARHGGTAIPVQVDYTAEPQVRRLFERVGSEHGRLDLLVNNVNGDDLADWSKPFWEQSLDKGLLMLQRGIHTHLLASHAAIPLLLRGGGGLIAGITDRGAMSFFHGFVKTSVMRIAELLAPELRQHRIAMVALTPGFLRSEAVLEHFGVTESNWRDAVKKDPYFAGSETPFYVGRAVAALAADPKAILKTGSTLSSWGLAEEYGFTDVDGQRPHWERSMAPALDQRWAKLVQQVRSEFKKRGLDPAAYIEEDRKSLTLRARLSPEDEPPRWYRQEMSFPEVIHCSAKRLAADLYERYTQLR
jgi:NAD(P)-dependent dehydrogenase (short-subunit alcohol dehydrogenase family)